MNTPDEQLGAQVRTAAAAEIADGERFGFGANWRKYSRLIDESVIAAAAQDITGKLGTTDLSGRTFLDIGSGSGLSSLVAHRLGATVISFDYDPDAVECTRQVRQAWATPGGPEWQVLQGSVLDRDFLQQLPPADIVYSWGVLHHTGDLWTALANAAELVAVGSTLFVALYNDQGLASRMWTRVKRTYVGSGPTGRTAIVTGADVYFRSRLAFSAALTAGATRSAKAGFHSYRQALHGPRGRGMDRKHDLVDWVGGYPFEVSTPDQVFGFLRDQGFELTELRTCGGGLGCNVFVARRRSLPG